MTHATFPFLDTINADRFARLQTTSALAARTLLGDPALVTKTTIERSPQITLLGEHGMLQVQNYLRAGQPVESLDAEFGVAAFRHPMLPLVGLKYRSHASRFDPLVRQCRGLVLEDGSWEVVAKPFDRFLNAGEDPDALATFRWDGSSSQAKEDGSLVIVYPYRGAWLVNSSGGFGHQKASFSRRTWTQLFWEASGLDVTRLDPRYTHLFELCSPFTKVVRLYPQPTAFLLAMFETATCRELAIEVVDEEAARLGAVRPERFSLLSMGEVTAFLEQKEAADPTFEGIIIRDEAGLRFKIKTRTYLSAHHAGGTGNLFHPARLVAMALSGEIDEVVAYHPEIRTAAEGVAADLDAAWEQLRQVWARSWRIDDQRDFAQTILKATPFASLLFAMRRQYAQDQSEAELRRLWQGSGDLIVKVLYSRAAR